MSALKQILGLLKDTAREWSEDKVPTLAAALSFYTILSIAPLMLILIAIIGLVYGGTSAEQQIIDEVRGTMGDAGASTIESIISGASRPGTGVVALVFGSIMLLLGASGVFAQLQNALNLMWGVKPTSEGSIWRKIWLFVWRQFSHFLMVLGIGVIFLAALVASSVTETVAGSVAGSLPAGGLLFRIADFIVSFAIITFLFALMFKVIPMATIKWSDVWVGAVFTSFLFTLGKLGIGLYLNHSGVGSSFGAFGGLVLLLIWIYYSAQVVFFGAEFTHVYANRFGSQIRPQKNAKAIAGPSESETRADEAATAGEEKRPEEGKRGRAA